MRIDRKSPRSSVTCWSLLSDQGRRTRSTSSSKRGLPVEGRVRKPAEPGRSLRGGGRRRRTCPLADPGEARSELVGRRGIELHERVANDPRPVAVVGGGRPFGLGSKSVLGGPAVDCQQGAI